MANVQTTTNDQNIEFLFFSNPFQAEATAEAPQVEMLQEVSQAERIYKLIKRGTFGLGRQQVIDAFIAVGGKTAAGQPVDLKAIIKLCMEVTAESRKTGNSANHLRIWFDPFSGRLELTTGNGLRDNLTVWAMNSFAA